MATETPTERWNREAIENRDCRACNHCGWEPDSDFYCGHPEALEHVSRIGASLGAMARLGLCVLPTKQLWELRDGLQSGV